MEKKPKLIPDYFISRRNTTIQILFTTAFAYFFINVYKPFGSGDWYVVDWWVFSFFSGLVVLSGMLVVLASRVLLFVVKRKRPITVRYYALTIAAEIVLMGAMFTLVERLALEDDSPFLVSLFIAVQNTSLILLIPYLISSLFFAWWEKKISLDKLIRQLRSKPQFFSFVDENQILKLTIKSGDLLYLESNDNYVIIHYKAGEKLKIYQLRNTLKKVETQFEGYPLLRCHRSFMVNMDQIKMLKRDGTQVNLWLDDTGSISIPVSKSYIQQVNAALEKA